MIRLVKCGFAALMLVVGSQASAAGIQILTGHDGGALAAGALDSEWQISVQGGPFVDAKVAYPIQICCGMGTIPGDGAWLTDPSVTSGSNATGWGVNRIAKLRTTFDLSGYDHTTAVLNALYRAADYTRGIYLNGTQILGTDTGSAFTFAADRVLPIAGQTFVAGVNTLEFWAGSVNSQYDAFWFDGMVTADRLVPAVPVPAAVWLLVGALGSLQIARRKT